MASATFTLTAFADEISPDLEEQTQVLERLRVQGLDLRSVGGVNVLDLSVSDLDRVRETCAARGIKVQSIGSPVNKVPYSVMNQASELVKLNKAIKAAQHLNVKRIRIFSPETPEDQHDALATHVIAWLQEQKRRAADQGVVLIHENDARFWGAYPKNAKRLFSEIGDSTFRACFDFANTVLLGFRPFDDWFPWLLPYLDTIHIKDATKADGKIVPSGEGDGQMMETLKWLIGQGWEGPLTLEPHLSAVGPFGGFSGERLFEEAVQALRKTLHEAGGEG